MPAVVLVGAQWGDEGKGKVTDLLGVAPGASGDAPAVSHVVRYQGGNNAGHTVITPDGEEFALHLVPSGVLAPGVVPVVANGVVVDPEVLAGELDGLDARGVDTSRLLVSHDAHVIMPHHRALDRVAERWLGSRRIGTTGRGIGPCYADKAARLGVRVADLLDRDVLAAKVEGALRTANQVLVKVYNRRALDADAVVEEYLGHGERLRPYVCDTVAVLDDALRAGRTVLLEGSQGTHLDVDHGTYPFVTSSSPTAGGACAGSGIGPTRVSRVVGIAKAYTTRVGSGPFPTELHDADGERLRADGGEFGTTTGRPRRCGWFDAPLVRRAVVINGMTDVVLTKLDVLSGREQVPVCVGYAVDGRRLDGWPATQAEVARAEPVLEHLPGWSEDLGQARELDDLPRTARDLRRTARGAGGLPDQRRRRRPRARGDVGPSRPAGLTGAFAGAGRARRSWTAATAGAGLSGRGAAGARGPGSARRAAPAASSPGWRSRSAPCSPSPGWRRPAGPAPPASGRG